MCHFKVKVDSCVSAFKHKIMNILLEFYEAWGAISGIRGSCIGIFKKETEGDKVCGSQVFHRFILNLTDTELSVESRSCRSGEK